MGEYFLIDTDFCLLSFETIPLYFKLVEIGNFQFTHATIYLDGRPS